MKQARQRLIVGIAAASLAATVSAAAEGPSARDAIKFPYTLNESDLTQIIEIASGLDLNVASPLDSLETWKHNSAKSYGAKFVFSPFETTDRTARHFELICAANSQEIVEWQCQKTEITKVSVALDESPDVIVLGDENTNLSEAVDVMDLVYGSERKFSHPTKIVEVDNGFDVGYFTGRCTEFLPVRWSEGAGEFQVPEIHRVRQECPKRSRRPSKN